MRLFLCEKPSQAKDIAKVLGATRRGDGCWIGNAATVTWCIGHLLETAPPDAYDVRYKRWVLADLPIIPQQWKMQVKRKTASQFKVVKRLLGEAGELVIATDADREGEMIAANWSTTVATEGRCSDSGYRRWTMPPYARHWRP